MKTKLSCLFLATALTFGCSKKDDGAKPAAKSVATDPAMAPPAMTPPATPPPAMTPPATPPPAMTPPATPPPAMTPPAGGADAVTSDDDYMKKGNVQLDKMVEIFKSDGANCDKLATDMAAMMANPAVVALSTYDHAHHAVKKAFSDATKDKTKAFEAAAGPALKSCGKNAKFLDVMNAMAKMDQ